MIKKLIIGFLIVETVLMHILLYPVVREAVHWKKACSGNLEDHYAVYIKKYPKGRHIKKASIRFDERGWQETVSVNQIPAYERYLNNHPRGKYIRIAQHKLDSLLWVDASRKNTISGYQYYLDHLKNGLHVQYAGYKVKLLKNDSKPYLIAKTFGTKSAYERFLADFPGHKDEAEAREALGKLKVIENDSILWSRARSQNTVSGLQTFLEQMKSDKYRIQAKNRLDALLKTPAPYLKAESLGTKEAFQQFLNEYPGHALAGKAKQAITNLDGRNIADLVREGVIEAHTSGTDIENVDVDIKRKVKYPVKVSIPAGTYFVCSGSAQNMVATESVSYTLDDDDSHSMSISAACANRTRDIPDDSDRFSIGRSPNQKELQKLMPVLEAQNASTAVLQAAVWIITDDADYDDLGILVSRSAYDMYGGTRVIEEDEAAQAMKYCDMAGIDIRKKSIWYDRSEISKGVNDSALKEWIEQKSK